MNLYLFLAHCQGFADANLRTEETSDASFHSAVEGTKSEYDSDLNPPLRPVVSVLLTVAGYPLNVAVALMAGYLSKPV